MFLKGLFAVLTTPFDHNNAIDLMALDLHIAALKDYVSGFTVGGTTGESGSLSDEEIKIILQTVRKSVPKKPLIAGFWRPTIKATRAAVQTTAAYADALLIPIPPELFRAGDDAIAEYYYGIDRLLSDQRLDTEILLYNYPKRCDGRAISAALATKLATRCPRVTGVKDSSTDAELTFEIIKRNLPLQPLLGNDRFLCEVLQLIKQQPQAKFPAASISGASSVPIIAKTEARIYSEVIANRDAEAKSSQKKLNKTLDAWNVHSPALGGQPPIIKFLAQQQLPKYPINVRPPLKGLTPTARL